MVIGLPMPYAQSRKSPTNCIIFVEIVFFSLIASMSVLGGFGMTLTLAKRKDPKWFGKVCIVYDDHTT